MTGEKTGPTLFNCPQCGMALQVSALGYTSTIVCLKCSAVLDALHPLYRKIDQFNLATSDYKPFFDLGTFGQLKGIKWKIIGYMVRRDQTASFSWEEYLLYNPLKGFRWLLRIDKHFSLTTKLLSKPSEMPSNQVRYNNELYSLFNVGEAAVEFVAGEFYWRVKTGETVAMRDYISPPFMISEEKSTGSEITWSISEYLTNKEVLTAFNKEKLSSTSEPQTVAANQPNPHNLSKAFLRHTFYAVFGLCIVASISGIIQTGRVIKTEKLGASAPTVSNTFEIPGKMGNLEFLMDSPINNEWVDAGITLVNEESGEDFSFNHGLEFYSGRDSDGSWEEGSRSDGKTISSVPGGTYHLEVDLAGNMKSPEAQLTIKRNSTMTSNFLLALFLLMAPMIFRFWRSKAFEINRWSNSEFSKYATHDVSDGDDE